MLSTLLSYQLYTRDMPRSLERVAADPIAKREADYYKANIGKVATLDAFLDDYVLYSYAMKAFGLEDQIPSKALIRKVLESDLSDPASFANKLSDDRYRDFAGAFDFPKPGEAAPTLKAQTTEQSSMVTEAYSEHRVRAANTLAGRVAAYEKGIGQIATVDQFLDDPALFAVALESVGIDSTIASRQFIRDVLTGDAADGPAANGDTRYVMLAAMLPFAADGTIASGNLQTPSEVNETIYAYFEQKGLAATPQAAAYQVSYYESRMPSVETADQFTKDRRLLDVALTSVGLDAAIESPAFVWTILTSDPQDFGSALNRMPEDTAANVARKESYKALVALFDFDTSGNTPASGPAQSAQDLETVAAGYFERYRDKATSNDEITGSLYRLGIESVTSLQGFLANKTVYEYALNAFDLDPDTESITTIRRVLTSDPSDPDSFAARRGDDRYLRLAAAFNFDEAGRLATQRSAQTQSSQAETAELYAALIEDPTAAETKAIEAETTAYKAALATVATLDDFLANDTILDYALKAYGLDGERLKTDELAAILTSDLSDPESFANAAGDERYLRLAGAFSFTTDGRIERGGNAVQSAGDLISIQKLYLQQQLEAQAGAENGGVRLALYFQRKAPDIGSAFDILADPALFEVVRTALGLPAEMSQANIDLQARMIEKKLDIDSLQDPKALDRFIARFVTLYDLQTGGGGMSSPALTILGGGGMGGII